MRLAILAFGSLLMAACAADPATTSFVPERNASAESDANRGIVCRNETPEGSEFSRPVCTTPTQRESQRETQRQPDSASDIERKPTL